MKRIANCRIYRCLSALLIVALCSVSCVKERLDDPFDPAGEGEDAVVSLQWSVPDMKVVTRAELSDEAAGRVDELWVGIYNKHTGKCTHNRIHNVSSADLVTPHPIEGIETKSGDSYIVAVANPRSNYGISELIEGEGIDSGADAEGNRGIVPLYRLLQHADTWEKYRSISAAQVSPTNIDLFTANLIMQGSYFDNADITQHPEGHVWNDAEGNPLQSVYITAGACRLDGYIHLRRLISYNRFLIRSAKNVSVDLVSWRVRHNPVISYLQEREGADGENAADVSRYFEGNTDQFRTNHGASNISYIFEDFDDGEGGTVTGFDFYQFENKHTAPARTALGGGDYYGVEDYNDRDREYKAPADEERLRNTGIYKSLCATPDAPDIVTGTNVHNYASFVEFEAMVRYYILKSEAGTPEQAQLADPVDPEVAGAENVVLRMGQVRYVVHLGYCEGKAGATPTAATARDFNCRRNTKYTYNVTIEGLKRITVEAVSDEEGNPGAEGSVTDTEDQQMISLDSHYAVFNIRMSDNERRRMNWRISAPYDHTTYTLNGSYEHPEDEAMRNNKFYNWIRFKPTVSEELLAVYREQGITDAESDKALWTLRDMCNVDAEHAGLDSKGKPVYSTGEQDKDAETPRWYTVFINEYTYEDSADETSEEWKKYVNLKERIVWLNTKEWHESSDTESTYTNAQYMITQRSIQTYYDPAKSHTALGVEYDNESFGMNLRWEANTAGLNEINGRWNTWRYLSGDKDATSTVLTVSICDRQQIRGRSYVPRAVVPAIAAKDMQLPESYPTVFQLSPLGSGAASGNAYDPTPGSPYYELLKICMSRNRDENGNGVIDREELKWYLPTANKYLRIIMGRSALREPLMDFDVPKEQIEFVTSNNTYCGAPRFHYGSSDHKRLWAEEGVSVSNGLRFEQTYAWQVRCCRNLGIDLSTISENDPVDVAYQLNEGAGAQKTDNLFTMSYYTAEVLCAATSSYLLAHAINSRSNTVTYRFEVADEDCSAQNMFYADEASGSYLPLTVEKQGEWFDAKQTAFVVTNDGKLANQKQAGSDQKVFFDADKKSRWYYNPATGYMTNATGGMWWGDGEFTDESGNRYRYVYDQAADRGTLYDSSGKEVTAADLAGGGDVVWTLNNTDKEAAAEQWIATVNRNGICRYYSQKADRSDLGSWRTPNQTALAMIQTSHLLSAPTSAKWLSCTYEYYTFGSGTNAFHRIVGAAPNIMTLGENGDWRVRCIRDVIDR